MDALRAALLEVVRGLRYLSKISGEQARRDPDGISAGFHVDRGIPRILADVGQKAPGIV